METALGPRVSVILGGLRSTVLSLIVKTCITVLVMANVSDQTSACVNQDSWHVSVLICSFFCLAYKVFSFIFYFFFFFVRQAP